MRMELADHVANHAGALFKRRAGIEPQLLHRIQQPPVHRLETVACIRQRAVHDCRERVCEVALLERVAQRNLFRAVSWRGNQLLAHGRELLPSLPGNKPAASEVILRVRPRHRQHQAPMARAWLRARAPRKLARASASLWSLGSRTWRMRKDPVRAKPATTSSKDTSPTDGSRRNTGNMSTLSFHGSPARRETARPDFGET